MTVAVQQSLYSLFPLVAVRYWWFWVSSRTTTLTNSFKPTPVPYCSQLYVWQLRQARSRLCAQEPSIQSSVCSALRSHSFHRASRTRIWNFYSIFGIAFERAAYRQASGQRSCKATTWTSLAGGPSWSTSLHSPRRRRQSLSKPPPQTPMTW